MSDVDDQVIVALNALRHDSVRHDIKTPDEGNVHRLVVNGNAGPWVSGHAIARNGLYCATTPLFAEFFGHAMPRVFFAIAIQNHPDSVAEDLNDTKLRQPSPRAFPRSAGDEAVSNPDPGDEAGIETTPPPVETPSRASDGGVVPRLDRPCEFCGGKATTPDVDDGAEHPCGWCNGTGRLQEPCVECGRIDTMHTTSCPLWTQRDAPPQVTQWPGEPPPNMCKGCNGSGRVGPQNRLCRACGGAGCIV